MNKLPNDPETIAREWAQRHPGFIRDDSDLMKHLKKVKMKTDGVTPVTEHVALPKRFTCKYCAKEFIYKAIYQKHLTCCTVQLNNDTIKPAVKATATKTQPSDMEFIDNRPIDYKAIDDMAAKKAFHEWQQRSLEYAKSHPFSSLEDAHDAISKLQPPEARPKPITTTPAPESPNAYAPTTKADGFIQTYGTPAKITPPAPVPPAVSHKVDAVYYLIMAILSMLALCLTIAAALGIKLLVGW